MNKFFLLSVISILACGDSADAQESIPHYLYFGVNYVLPDYPEPLASRTSFASRIPGSTHVPLHLDAPGYFRGYGKLTLIGGIFQADVDHYSAYGERLQIEFYQPSFSAFHYLDGEIGSGLFIRGDVGPALMRLSSHDRGTEKSSIGWGYLFGGGVSMTVRSTILLASVNYANKSFNGDAYRFISLGIGVMLKKSR